jgi:hypothetical protein
MKKARLSWFWFFDQVVNDPLPFHTGVLEVDQQAYGQAGASKIVQALRHVLFCQFLYAFQLDNECVFDKDVGEVLPDALTFIRDRERTLCLGANTPHAKFGQERPLIDFFEEPGPEHIRNLKHSSKHSLR